MTRAPLLLATAIVAAGSGLGTNAGAGAPRSLEIVYEADGAVYVTRGLGSAGHPVGSRTRADSDPAWSPDHRRIAFVRTAKIWVMDASGRRARRVTHGRNDVEPDWAPDGKRLVYRGDSANGLTSDLYVVAVGGNGTRKLTRNPDEVSVTNPAWSVDGRRIAFQRTHSMLPTDTGVFTIGSDAKGLKRIAPAGHAPAWSPDSKRIAFMLNGFAGWQIFVSPAGGGPAEPLTPTGSSVDPAWCRDGRHIVFVRNGRIAVMNADGTGVRFLPRPTPESLVGNPDC